jgi:glycosyltransferase involved in cell wall biosynthesis
MRILHVTPFHESAIAMGGIAVGTGSLARAQVRAGADVTVFTTDLGMGKTAVPQAGGVDTRCFHVGKMAPSFLSGQMINALVKELSGFDIVHIHGLWNLVANSAALLAICGGHPFVLSPRGMMNRWAFRYRRWKKVPVWYLFQRHVVRNAACLMFTSEEEQQQSLALIDHHSTTVVPFGPEGPQGSTNWPRGIFRARLGVDAETPLLAFVGRIHPVKGLHVLLEAIQSASESIPGLQIVIAGPDDHRHQMHLQQHTLRLRIVDRVHWVGALVGDEKRALLQDADLFMFVSFSENLGLAAIEAMASGTAVVLGEGVNVAALVKKYDAGWVVPTEKVAITKAIREALCKRGLRIARAQRATKLVAEQFNPDVNAQKTLDIYHECLKQIAGRRGRITGGLA